ncbi:MAG: DUF6179 domain-containing protein, partial [Faecousia sp.]
QFEMAQSEFTPRDLLKSDLYAVLKDGQAHLTAKVEETKRLWELACAQTQADVDTLGWIGCFFKKYDLYFFAHQTPWDMGYPLLLGVAEPLKGISYVEAYLREMLDALPLYNYNF